MHAVLVFCLTTALPLVAAAEAGLEARNRPQLSPFTRLAQIPDQPPLASVLECRSILGVVQRLGCYDAAVGADRGLGAKYRRGGVGSGTTEPARWQFTYKLDPFSEGERSTLRLALQGPLGDQQDRGLEAIDLTCDGEGGVLVSITAQRYLGVPGQPIGLRFRFGSGPVRDELWSAAKVAQPF